MFDTRDGRKVGYYKSPNGKHDEFVYAGRCRPVTISQHCCKGDRSDAL
jgi:hypothetical protein